ncbi:MAG: HEAT repeat domain-containing protein [Aggregatilineales bacterium]
MSKHKKPDIWRLQAQFDIGGLTRALEAGDAGIRKRAAAALRAMGAIDAVDALRAAFAIEQDTDVRASIASALEALTEERGVLEDFDVETTPEHEAYSGLLDELQSKDTERIIAAAHKLGDMGDKMAVEPLVFIFNDTKMSIQVRLAVAEALLKLESAPVTVALLANLRHSEWNTRRKAAAILGQLRAEWAVEPLAKALGDPHTMVRRTSRAALKRIATPEARRALIRDNRLRQSKSSAKDGNSSPAAASGGLLKRVEGKKKPPAEMQPHLQPTQPLNPDVVDQARERFKRKAEEQNRKNDRD